MDGIFQQVVIAAVLAFLGYLTGHRVKHQDSGWERLLAASVAQVSNLQKSLTAALDRVDQLERMLRQARAEALACPRPHPSTEKVEVTGSMPTGRDTDHGSNWSY